MEAAEKKRFGVNYYELTVNKTTPEGMIYFSGLRHDDHEKEAQ